MRQDSDHCDCVVTETSIQTCPLCLPVGAISWLIENGRQLELELPGRVDPSMRGGDTEGSSDQVISSERFPPDDLPF